TRVRLNYKGTPLVAAVEDLAKRTGAPIRLGNRSDFYGRTVTLTTDPLPFWLALEQFCDKAKLHEDITLPPIDDETDSRRRRAIEDMAAQNAIHLAQLGILVGQPQFALPKPNPSTYPNYNQQI